MKEFRKILKYARPYTKSLVFAFICLTLTSLVNLVLPLIVRNMINAVVILKDSQILDGLAWDLFFIIILQAVFAVTHNYVFGFVGHRMTTDFRIEFFSHIQSLSLRFFQERRVGEILSRMNNDISVIQNALVSIPVALLRQSITLIGAMAIILYLNWKLTGLILLILPPLMIFARVFGKRLRLFSEKLQDQVAQAVVVLEEVASSIKIVKSFTRENYERERFKKEIETAFERAVDKLKISSFFGPFILGLTFMVSAVLIWYGGYQVMSGVTTPGELAAFFLYALMLSSLVMLVADINLYNLLNQFNDPTYVPPSNIDTIADNADNYVSIASFINIGILIIAYFFGGRWIYKSNLNLQNISSNKLRFSPGWSVGWYFIPIFSIWKPYQAMKEIYLTSQRIANPNKSPILPGSFIIWWLLWLIGNYLGWYYFRQSLTIDSMSLQEIINLSLIAIVFDIIDVITIFMFLNIVKNINHFEQKIFN